ncbi:MAG TPA: pyridoxal-phosphate dependent enzyme [Terriglobia bacterium]|jgi:threonine dehydratase|nr:pyridoxal-phosphate dependent enzyme [Terriglobia bacterium]
MGQPSAAPTAPKGARPTVTIEASRLGQKLGVSLLLATETFQHTGSFKFRAAYHLASHVSNPMIIAASSGNFGQALAYACSLVGKRSIIVMPQNSARVKVDAVREYGGEVDFVDVRVKSRATRVAELAAVHPEAYVASAYDDPLVIEGNSSLGEELARLDRPLDCVVAPVGGGGLTSGIITGLRRAGSALEVVGAEPLAANDAARSLREGRIVANEAEPQTMADGARTVSVGVHNWAILRRGLKDGLAGIVEVPEEHIARAVRLLFELANLKAEPTGALSVGALLTDPDRFRDRQVCCVISGGNVDPAVYRELLGM